MFAFLKNNYDICSCEHILNTGKAIVVYRQFESLCEPFRAAMYCFPAVCVRSARGLFFYCFCSICEHRTKLAPHCPKPALTRGVSSKHRPILRWPRNASTSNKPNSIPFLCRTATHGGTGCMKRSATSASYMTGAAATPAVLLSTTIKPQSYDSGLR